ncbi:hypothetical protein SAY86_004333 [Trapa natans]|uniref:Uncharacterized protein n=1 Tax=Trapa natans TaxID=22666 RepID=A0AAN7N438_TRANT|nr:hypothetical protein SAY86_004333 [Trapa natans]
MGVRFRAIGGGDLWTARTSFIYTWHDDDSVRVSTWLDVIGASNVRGSVDRTWSPPPFLNERFPSLTVKRKEFRAEGKAFSFNHFSLLLKGPSNFTVL